MKTNNSRITGLVVKASFLLCFALPLAAAEDSEYLEFFQRYDALYQSFDPEVIDLYSDQVVVSAVQILPDGGQRTLQLKGEQWKEMLRDSLGLAKKRGDRSEYTNIAVEHLEDGARITADRYSTVKCFQDDGFHLRVRKEADGQLRIVEAAMQSPMQTRCEGSENDVELVLQGAVDMLSKQLPIMVDQDTQLKRVSSDGKVLTLHYVLVNITVEELDLEAYAEAMRPALLQNSCTVPSFKGLIDQGGRLAYSYRDRDGREIYNLQLGAEDCSG